MGHSKVSQSDAITSRFNRNLRILRATIVRENMMRQLNAASFISGDTGGQTVINNGNAIMYNPIKMMQKHNRFMRMLFLREKRLGYYPSKEFCSRSVQLINDAMLADNSESAAGGGGGGGEAIASCDMEANHISPDQTKHISPEVQHVSLVDAHVSETKVEEDNATQDKTDKIDEHSATQDHNSDKIDEHSVTQDESDKTSELTASQYESDKIVEDTEDESDKIVEDTEDESDKIDEDIATRLESDKIDDEDDELTDIWKEMDFAMETCKESPVHQIVSEDEKEDEDDCAHSYVLRDDIGYVCRVCGLVKQRIENVFEYVYPKKTRARSSYQNEPQNIKDKKPTEDALPEWCKLLGIDDVGVAEVLPHAKHIKQMKPHQMEGFNFLLKNLVTENPHGCILAHAPGSGKTFMIICFLQSYLAKFPSAKPLVVLPKGILGTWKKEFLRWKLDDIPLYDFYSAKAVNRSQQLNVLKQWADNKSILFLGYKQFSSIMMGNHTTNDEMEACKKILARAPNVLILDEGHTPRNQNTDILYSLTQVQTRRKVVLSGTLYQNHVQEVFNILNLVQPRFLKSERNRGLVKRIMSKVDTHGVRKQLKGAGDAAFYDLVENTLVSNGDIDRKFGIIKDLREMTSHVLHYFKGDSFDELPGLVDFTVMLNLSPKQKDEVDEMKKVKERKFKSNSLGSAIYLHPELKQLSGNNNESKVLSDENVDQIIKKMNLKEGAKAMFFLNMIRLCEIVKEKLLVFSQYLLPLKFLERLAVHDKGWSMNKEMFMITGESTQEQREWSMEHFNSSPNARVLFGSVKACGEGISLVGASRVLILDIHPNPSVTWQAICRAFRPGQQKKVFTYRVVAADSPEEDDYKASCEKEMIAKLWFEWDGISKKDLILESEIDFENCSDIFLENPMFKKDIKALYQR